MKFQDRSQIETLAKFKSQGDLVTSLYLDTDKGRMGRKEIHLSLKNLLNEAKDRACGLSAAKEKTDALLRDLDLISEFGSQSLGSSNAPGLAIFSASRQGLQAGAGAAPRPPQPHHLRRELLPPPPGVDPGQVQPYLRRPHRPARGRLVRRRDGRDQVPRQDPERRPLPGQGGRFRGDHGEEDRTPHRRPPPGALQEGGPEDVRHQQEAPLRLALHRHRGEPQLGVRVPPPQLSLRQGQGPAALPAERFAGQGPPGGPRGRDPAEESGRGGDASRSSSPSSSAAARPRPACGTPSIA